MRGIRIWNTVIGNKRWFDHRGKRWASTLRKLTIGKKLALGFVAVNIIMILLGILNLSNLAAMHADTTAVINDEMSPILLMAQAQHEIDSIRVDLVQVESAAATSRTQQDFFKTELPKSNDITGREKVLTKYVGILEKTRLVAGDQADWNQMFASLLKLDADTQTDLSNLSWSFSSSKQHAVKLNSDEDVAKVSEYMNRLMQYAQSEAARTQQTSVRLYRTSLGLSVAGLIAAILVSVLVVSLIIRSISRSMRSIIQQMENISHSHGDLTQRLEVKSQDEMGQLSSAFNAMMDSIQQIVQRVADSAEKVGALATDISAWSEQVLGGAEEISSASQQIAAGAESQASSVHDASQRLNEMVAQLTALRQAASEALAIASRNTQTSVAQGQHAVEIVRDHMASVVDSMQNLSEQMETLNQKAGQIGRIVGMITAIASQSRLLALNASIEAARAGEHGRGFSVVALEVRKLADQSREAAMEIQRIVESIGEQVGLAVSTAEVVRNRVGEGQNAIHTSWSEFDQIKDAVDAMVEQVQQTMAGVNNIVSESKAVSERMSEVVHVSETAAASAEEVSAAIEQQTTSLERTTQSIHELAAMADGLKSMIAQFRY
ncbi:MAG: methyl-accepting chemotaxis protein [Alicyclobacillaceae bacterium]|nr:methyl-accepting chemotaxis protein [Alicyclobacillaceae bacterium]